MSNIFSKLILEWKFSNRYLFSRYRDGFVSVISLFSLIGITLGVAVLITVMSVMNGFREDLIEHIVGINGHVTLYHYGEGFTDEEYTKMRDELLGIENVVSVVKYIEGHAMATNSRGSSTGLLLKGITRDDASSLQALTNPENSKGSLDDFLRGNNTISIGSGVARKLGLTIGDAITVISPNGPETPYGVIPSIKDYKVAYIFQMGLSQYDKVLAYVDFQEAGTMLKRNHNADLVEISIKDPDSVTSYIREIEKKVGPHTIIQDWKTANNNLIKALIVEKQVMRVILTLIIVIAALNIASGLVIFVKDKSSDIAILKTLGMKRIGIMRVFLMIGVSIGFVGTLLGIVLGILCSINIDYIEKAMSYLAGISLFDKEIYYLSNMPSRIEALDIVSVSILSLFVSFMATLYPAWKASGVNPLKILRNG